MFGRKEAVIVHMEIILDSYKVFAPSGVHLACPLLHIPSLIYILSLLLLSLQSVAKPYRSGRLQKPIP